MRVTKAQAQLNRAHIVETASRLFRERGYDGVGVADLMAAAGFTHGGFYKHFRSKADLMAEAAACGLSQSMTNYAGLGAAAFFDHYVSREHRDDRSVGCTMAALCGDAARQSDEVKATFAEGIENALTALGRTAAQQDDEQRQAARAKMIDRLARAVGAVVLSRACPDESPLADEIIEVCHRQLLESLAP
ncbi:TetR family transcriptional regulator [Pseudomonas sp. Tri1]|uniref:TetR family transcriptional regulator n=1 Tax=Pseudomonas sp. Tri1 TaxID=2823875 RepID=UPI001B33A4C7|nr:TetR family transcriptional regulator [Pseudomonas sp. Tri1]